MTIYQGAAEYCHGTAPAVGVLLTNLGTPAAPTPAALRHYLAEFLWDPRVVEAPRWLWWLALHCVILRIRPARSAHAYQKIWSEQGSPLLAISRRQAEAVQQTLQARYDGRIAVALGMRYGAPSIREGLEQLRAANVRRILVFPLYPQYSASTTASTFDAVAEVLRTWRWLPELRMINHYYDDAGYIGAVADSIREAWRKRPPAERLMFSFHGLPKRYLLQGDPYHCECHKTARLIAEQLNLPEDRWQVAFQSRFGREEWLKPYADHTLQEWAKNGVKSVDIVCPGFSADCLETLEEVAMQNRDIFFNAGGERYHYIPALNDNSEHIKILTRLIELHTQGWPELHADVEQQKRAAETSKRRALELGAKR